MSYSKDIKNNINDWQVKQNRGRIAFGILVAIVGVLYLLHQMDYGIPDYIFKWPTILIGISIISFIKNGFKQFFWTFLFLIMGLLFMFNYAYPDVALFQYKIAIILILVGLGIAFIPKKNKHHIGCKAKHHHKNEPQFISPEQAEQDDYVYVNNVFSGTEKTVITKSLKGGEISNSFGGCEINFLNADIEGEAIVHIHQHFSGLKLMVPSNWTIKPEINSVFAGIEDKRSGATQTDTNKTLILRGSIFMSGLEIVAY